METRSGTPTGAATSGQPALGVALRRDAENRAPMMAMFVISCRNLDQLRTSWSWGARWPTEGPKRSSRHFKSGQPFLRFDRY